MLQVNAKIQADIQKGFRFAVLLIRKLAVFKLNGLPINGNFWHIFILAQARIPAA